MGLQKSRQLIIKCMGQLTARIGRQTMRMSERFLTGTY